MAAAHRMTREEEYLKNEDFFRRNAFLVIKEMVGMASLQHPSVFVDEVLHSIFFLGEINNPKYNPKDIVSDDNMLNKLKGCYPEPFKRYSSQLPKRSPISCVLDMIVLLIKQENENKIIKKLQELILQLKKDEATDLVSSTICVSQRKTPNSVRYYGVSMSTSGRNPGRIMTAASCLSNWENYVAGAVMSYDSKKNQRPYFDGTIKLPESVRCQALNISQGKEMSPCRSCGNLFGLKTSEKTGWPYGNCAEVESVSNLLKNEEEVRKQARPTSDTYTDANRQRAEETVLKELTDCLRMLKFKWDENFYTPQQV